MNQGGSIARFPRRLVRGTWVDIRLSKPQIAGQENSTSMVTHSRGVAADRMVSKCAFQMFGARTDCGSGRTTRCQRIIRTEWSLGPRGSRWTMNSVPDERRNTTRSMAGTWDAKVLEGLQRSWWKPNSVTISRNPLETRLPSNPKL